MQAISKVTDLAGKKVLVRADFNVPIVDGKVRDGFRIEKTMPTINYLREKGAKVILISHIGENGTESLAPVAEFLRSYIPIFFVKDIVGNTTRGAIASMNNGDVILLENLRQDKGEKENNNEFTLKLCKLADIYVNEAFAASHRNHASIVGLPPCMTHYMGIQFALEISNLSKALAPSHPFLFILGGAKFSTKLPLISKYLETAEDVFIGGALVTNFYKAKGYEIGKSLFDPDGEEVNEFLKSKKIILPKTVITSDESGKSTKSMPASQLPPTEKIVDIAPEAIEEALSEKIKNAKLIVWNGPMGNYENGYDRGTAKLLELIADSNGTTILGGGDTVALINKMHLADKFTFISTGGGATLDFLANGTLPGIEALGK